MKIRARLSLSFIGHTLMVLSLFGGTYYFVERRAVLEAQREDQQSAVAQIAQVCKEARLAFNPIIALNYLDVISKDPAFVSAACLDRHGLVQAHSDATWIGRSVTDPEHLKMLGASSLGRRLRSQAGVPVVEWHAPVGAGTADAGLALLNYSQAALAARTHERLWVTLRQLMAVACGTFLLALLAGVFLASGISRPIGDLARGADQISQGNLDARVPVRSGDELGELASHFNAMSQRLKELDELKDGFISMVSHDLRGPLGSIRMYVDYLLSEVRGPLNAEQKDILQVCWNSSNKLGIFITNILNSAKVKAGLMEYHFAPFSLGEAITPVVQLLRFEIARAGLQLSLPDLAASPIVQGDCERIEHVFSNLFSNAVKHTPNGGSILLRWEVSGSGQLQVTLENTGRGIPPDQLPHLFEAFYQADVARQKEMRMKGTGLGLSIVKETILKHGGQVWAESEPGKITRFHFLIPLAGGPTS